MQSPSEEDRRTNAWLVDHTAPVGNKGTFRARVSLSGAYRRHPCVSSCCCSSADTRLCNCCVALSHCTTESLRGMRGFTTSAGPLAPCGRDALVLAAAGPCRTRKYDGENHLGEASGSGSANCRDRQRLPVHRCLARANAEGSRKQGQKHRTQPPLHPSPPPPPPPPSIHGGRGGGGIAVRERQMQWRKMAGNRGKLRENCGAVTKPPEASRSNTSAQGTHRAPTSTQGGQAKSNCGNCEKL